MSLSIAITPNQLSLAQRPDPQVTYALVTITAGAGSGRRPVNWVLVADASRSMRIPIVSEEVFRELVKRGGAKEVLVDGVPVWQIEGEVPPEIRAQAPSALDHTARALHHVLERLDQRDRFALIACAETAETLAAGSGAERGELAQGINRLHELDLGEQTDLSRGLRRAFNQLEDGRRWQRSAVAPVERILLLTDGFTQFPEVCERLVREAGQEVTVSTFGLGGEFQEDLLTKLADLSGGRAHFLRRPEAIPAAVGAELAAAREVAVRSVNLSLQLPQGVQLRRATRLSPDLAPIEIANGSDGQPLLRLGDLAQHASLRVLLEWVAPPMPRRSGSGPARVRLAALHAQSGDAEARADLVAEYAAAMVPPPAIVLEAAARAAAVQHQQRALQAAARGDHSAAATAWAAAARRLADLGETALAEAAQREAQSHAQNNQGTGLAAKELTYSTRRLGEEELG